MWLFTLYNVLQGSWRDRLITRFKNIRKGGGKEKLAESSEDGRPPAKKSKTTANEKPSEFLSLNEVPSSSEDLSEAEYDDKVRELREESSKSRRKSKIMGELIVITYSNRRKWILEQYPPIREILEKYPFLQLERWVCIYDAYWLMSCICNSKLKAIIIV